MSERPWLSFGFFVPVLAALLLVIAVSCGGGATSTAAPQPESVAPAAEPAAEPEAMEETKDTGEAAEVQVAPTATPVPVPEAEVAAEPEAVTTGAEPYGTLTSAFQTLGRFSAHPRYGVSGEQHQFSAITTQEGPFTVDTDARFQPVMVEDWSIAADERTWTFKLKKGIEFHKGWGELRAEDVINTLQQIGAEDGVCACNQVSTIFNSPDGYFIALDDYTMELDTGEPNYETLSWMVTPGYGRIFSKTHWDKLRETEDEFTASSLVVGTGPFELTEDMSTDEWNFTAVRNHWRKTPEFANLKFKLIPEESTRLANFLTGKIDFWAAQEDSVPVVAEDQDTRFMSQKGTQEVFLMIWQNGYSYNGTDKQFPGYDPDDPWTSASTDLDSPEWERARKVREAIGLAVDRQKLVDDLLGGEGVVEAIMAWGPHKSRMPDSWYWPYDPDRAKQLLKEAGYEDGFDMPMTHGGTSGSNLEVACLAIADMLQDVGIRVKYENVTTTVLYQGYKDRTQRGTTCQEQSAFFQEPLYVHRWCYDPTGLWGCAWDHPWFTERARKAYTTFNDDDRWAMQLEMGQWMRDNALTMGIYATNQVYPLGPQLDSWEEHLSRSRPSYISALEYAKHRE